MQEQDLAMMVQWMREELQYGHAKTHGYEAKRDRLNMAQTRPDSVTGFMSRYWDAFQTLARYAEDSNEPRAIPGALQQLGKVPNGLVDKVGLMLWLQDSTQDDYIEEAVSLVQAKAAEGPLLEPTVYPLILGNRDLSTTSLGFEITRLSCLVFQRAPAEQLLDCAVNNAVNGLYTWAEYLNQLRQQGIEPQMPKPGLTSGEIQPWEYYS